MEDSFTPPYYHRNTVSEFSMLIRGVFDVAKLPPQLEGFCSLINTMSPHGPDKTAFEQATNSELKPAKVPEDNMGVMFESW